MSTNGSLSPWVGPITVTVPCSPTAAPWADGFENSPGYSGNSSNPNLPSCWAYDGTYGTSYSMGYGYRTTRIQVATHCTTTCTQVVEIPMLFLHQ